MKKSNKKSQPKPAAKALEELAEELLKSSEKRLQESLERAAMVKKMMADFEQNQKIYLAKEYQLEKAIPGKFQWLFSEEMKERFSYTDLGGIVWNAKYTPKMEIPRVALRGTPEKCILMPLNVIRGLLTWNKN